MNKNNLNVVTPESTTNKKTTISTTSHSPKRKKFFIVLIITLVLSFFLYNLLLIKNIIMYKDTIWPPQRINTHQELTNLSEDSIILFYNYDGNPNFSRFTAVDPTNSYKEKLVYLLENTDSRILSMKWSPDRKKLAYKYLKNIDNISTVPELGIIVKDKKIPTIISPTDANLGIEGNYDWWNESTLIYIEGNKLLKYDFNKNKASLIKIIEGINIIRIIGDNLYFNYLTGTQASDRGLDPNNYNIYKLNLNNSTKVETAVEDSTMKIVDFYISTDEKYALYLSDIVDNSYSPIIFFHKLGTQYYKKIPFVGYPKSSIFLKLLLIRNILQSNYKPITNIQINLPYSIQKAIKSVRLLSMK